MRFIAVQTSPIWMDIAANREAIAQSLSDARPENGDYLVLPEMCETGWTGDRGLCETLRGASPDSASWFSAQARARQVWIQAGVAEFLPTGRIANSVLVFDPDGSLRASYRKNFLFPSERSGFEPGASVVVLDLGAVRVSPMICYDLRFPELWRLAASAGAEAFLVSSSWPAVRHEHWRQLLVARAIENQACVVASNRTGSDPSLSYAGGSVAIDHLGQRVVECASEPGIAALRFDRPAFDAWRSKFGALRDIRPSLLGSIAIERR